MFFANSFNAMSTAGIIVIQRAIPEEHPVLQGCEDPVRSGGSLQHCRGVLGRYAAPNAFGNLVLWMGKLPRASM